MAAIVHKLRQIARKLSVSLPGDKKREALLASLPTG